MEKKDEYKRIAKNALRGQELLGDSVVYQNKSVLDDAFELLESEKNIYLTGIKDTDQIDYSLVRDLLEDSKFVFHTIDKMSRGG